ncbi:hypothetical protein LCGC14_1131710 [marine sediment metagenome]|uniref:KOW domain-containing protein n=1 Tax=marine sediment metagenome TaxID=412755 RepID=A0A0F9Q6N8_9ZZZZ
MAARRVEVGEKIRIRHGDRKGKLGVVTAHERRKTQTRLWNGQVEIKTHLTYCVEFDEDISPRRVPGSYLELI